MDVINIKDESQLREYFENITFNDFSWYAFNHGLSIDFIREFAPLFDKADVMYWHEVFFNGNLVTEKQVEEFHEKPCMGYWFAKEESNYSNKFFEKWKERADEIYEKD